MAPKNIKVIYFDARGRAEVLRLLLTAAGQPFEDVRLTKETWPAEKPNTPFGQVPCVELDGKRYGQSVAIANYLAREFGFHGKTNTEALDVDQVVQLVQDFISIIVKAFFNPDETKKLTLADISVFDIIDSMKERGVVNIDNSPKLKTLIEKVQSNEKLQSYLQNRKPTET